MSKRFGRNQRRKLRQALELEQQMRIEETTSLQRSIRKFTGDFKYIAEAMQRLRFTALMPAKSLIWQQPLWGPYRVEVTQFDDRVIGPDDTDYGHIELAAVDTYALSFAIKRHHHEFCTAVHFFVEGAGKYQGQWVYRVSEEALFNGIAPDFKRRFGLAIADELLSLFDDHRQRVRA